MVIERATIQLAWGVMGTEYVLSGIAVLIADSAGLRPHANRFDGRGMRGLNGASILARDLL